MLVIAGLGLYGLRDLTLGVLEYLRKADRVFVELYTSILPCFDLSKLEELAGKRVTIVRRAELEGAWLRELLKMAERELVMLLAPGDPFIATTHMSLRLEAVKRGIEVKVLPSPSVINAVAASTGLDFYKFCRPVTIVKPNAKYFPSTPYHVLRDNLARGLHTLFLLDLDVEKGYAMTAHEAVDILLELDRREGEGILDENTLFVAVARATSDDEIVKAFTPRQRPVLGSPPHLLIIPGLLNPVEAEALQHLAGAPPELLKNWCSKLKLWRSTANPCTYQ
jgi:diphthine synthase